MLLCVTLLFKRVSCSPHRVGSCFLIGSGSFCLLTGVLKGWLPTVCDFSGLTSFSSWIETPSFIIRVISRGFPDSSADKESVWHAGDPGSTPGSGRSPGEGIGYPLQYAGLEKFMDCIVHGVTKSWTWLSNFHITRLVPSSDLSWLHQPMTLSSVRVLSLSLIKIFVMAFRRPQII